MKQFVDASVSLSPNTPVWPGDPDVELTRRRSFEAGDGCNLTYASLSLHAGTHLDAPRHFIDGEIGVDQLDLQSLIGPCYVLDMGDYSGGIAAEHLNEVPACDRLVFRTSNTQRGLMHTKTFIEDYTHIAESAAREIVKRGIKLVGVDYLSIEGYKTGSHVVHQVILGANIVAVEGLDLTHVSGGWWELICLPAKFAGVDGAPTRAIFQR
jgi:arylformamidase